MNTHTSEHTIAPQTVIFTNMVFDCISTVDCRQRIEVEQACKILKIPNKTEGDDELEGEAAGPFGKQGKREEVSVRGHYYEACLLPLKCPGTLAV